MSIFRSRAEHTLTTNTPRRKRIKELGHVSAPRFLRLNQRNVHLAVRLDGVSPHAGRELARVHRIESLAFLRQWRFVCSHAILSDQRVRRKRNVGAAGPLYRRRRAPASARPATARARGVARDPRLGLCCGASRGGASSRCCATSAPFVATSCDASPFPLPFRRRCQAIVDFDATYFRDNAACVMPAALSATIAS